ncbi:MAG TPA: NUDIX domain-containing protein [Solirubrobacteraceae bacterium]
MSPSKSTRGRKSAGLLLFRGTGEDLQVLLVHPGGPFWSNRDLGAWSIPKGECEEGEDPRSAAWREFGEELGSPAPEGDALELGEVRQKAGKTVVAWAIAGDLDPETMTSNTFTMEWPPRSGRSQAFPEVDRAGWFSLAEARERINPAQAALLDRLREALDA